MARWKTSSKKNSEGGSLFGLRKLFKSAAGSGGPPRKKTWKGRVLDVVMWAAVLALAYFMFRKRCST